MTIIRQPPVIVSGGQTGVDRAAWDVAIALNLEQDGWVPKGCLAEDGTIPMKYKCREVDVTEYAVRTEKNVLDSSATLILGFGPLTGGTRFTYELCQKHHKSHLVIDLESHSHDELLATALTFLQRQTIKTLNVAGPRGSSRSDVYDRAYTFLKKLFESYLNK